MPTPWASKGAKCASAIRITGILSAGRALAVADRLRKAGIPEERMGVAGFGQFQPISPNDTPNRGRKIAASKSTCSAPRRRSSAGPKGTRCSASAADERANKPPCRAACSCGVCESGRSPTPRERFATIEGVVRLARRARHREGVAMQVRLRHLFYLTAAAAVTAWFARTFGSRGVDLFYLTLPSAS